MPTIKQEPNPLYRKQFDRLAILHVIFIKKGTNRNDQGHDKRVPAEDYF